MQQTWHEHESSLLRVMVGLGSFYTLEEFYNWPTVSELHAAYL